MKLKVGDRVIIKNNLTLSTVDKSIYRILDVAEDLPYPYKIETFNYIRFSEHDLTKITNSIKLETRFIF